MGFSFKIVHGKCMKTVSKDCVIFHSWRVLNKPPSPYLPTSKTCKSGEVEKKPRKTWRFPKYVLNENKNGRFLVSRYSLPSVHLLYSFAAYFEESVSVLLSMRGAGLNLLFTAVAFQRPKRTYVSRE